MEPGAGLGGGIDELDLELTVLLLLELEQPKEGNLSPKWKKEHPKPAISIYLIDKE